MPQRIEASGDNPGGWLLQGERLAVPETSIWQTIEASLLAGPEAPCIACGPVTLSRGEVAEAVRRIALAPGHRRVGLHLPRSLTSVILTLAIWRNGGAYVPIAADYPASRVAEIARSCKLDLIIADRALDLPGYSVAASGKDDKERPLYFHARDANSAAADGGESPESALCYIAHTSGSTGTPKGVMISHANLGNRLACMQKFLNVREQDRMLYKTSAVFDVHVWEFALPLASGCLLVIYPQTKYFDLAEIARIIVADRVTIVGFVPTLLRLLLDRDRFVSGNVLRAVLCGGEAWNAALANDFHRRLPGRVLHNSYGPTETTIAAANWKVPDSGDLRQICLGDPLPNTVFLIEDEDPIEAPPEAAGQVSGALAIGGAQVALGYVEERGETRFFERSIDGEMLRFYRSGDRVRLDLKTGSLHFQGRQDNQVKVNGVRIELEEIEEAICRLDGIEGCVAFVGGGGQSSQLSAIYKTRGNLPLRPAEIRQSCARLLPAVLIPAALRQVAGFPLCGNGKIDRASLILEFDRAHA